MARATIPIVFLALSLQTFPALRAQPAEPPGFKVAAAAFLRGDSEVALPLLREQAGQGYAPAEYLLALLHLTGNGVPRNEPAAAFWLHRAVLKDYLLAQYELAVMLDEGIGIDADAGVANVLLQHAATSGNASAEKRVRIMGAPPGPDQEELLAAQQMEQINDQAGAFLYRLRVARRGNAQAQYAVGRAYLLGAGAVHHPGKAVEWMRLSAAAGDVRSQLLLGTLLEHGEGVQHDPVEALKWYRAAAQQGDANAAEAARALDKRATP